MQGETKPSLGNERRLMMEVCDGGLKQAFSLEIKPVTKSGKQNHLPNE